MIYQFYLIVYLLVSIDCRSIRKVSEKNVTKRAADGEYVPDWIKLKGEVPGEISQVEPKRKPKKRLALPVNFVLRAVAEPDGEDYYDKGQGEGEEYYEKKEWSDLNRQDSGEPEKIKLNHTEISDIDGVVNIITKAQPGFRILPKLNSNDNTFEVDDNDEIEKEEKVSAPTLTTTEDPEIPEYLEDRKRENLVAKKDNEDDNSSTESPDTTTVKTAKEKENAERKAIVLSAVDQLKARHEEEQREISEKLQEETRAKKVKEEFEKEFRRGNFQSKHTRPKNLKNSRKIEAPDYDEYEEKQTSHGDDKYKIAYEQKTDNPKIKRVPKKNQFAGKLSVFKYPNLYEIQDDEKTTTEKALTTSRRTARYSSKFVKSTPKSVTDDENVHISLVPENNNSKEPTLFFPKRKKNKSRRKFKTTTADSSVAETVEEKTANKIDAPPPLSVTDFAPTANDSQVINSDTVTDVVAASTDKKEEKKADNFDYEKARGRDYSSHHDEVHHEKGKKAYEGVHDEEKAAKGHHDKEDHSGEYKDRSGYDKEHHQASAHYGAHHHEEHGKKQAKYEESGKHSKGHSTKGSHDIHKKEEYEKRVEFFEEDGDSSEEEKHGGHNHEHGHSEGGHFKRANHDEGHHQHHKGHKGEFAKGGFGTVHKGHKAAAGHDSHGHHYQDHAEKAGKNKGHKWIYQHGSPAKRANLASADRRTEKYFHGPQYYG